jgi:hypothetical protein
MEDHLAEQFITKQILRKIKKKKNCVIIIKYKFQSEPILDNIKDNFKDCDGIKFDGNIITISRGKGNMYNQYYIREGYFKQIKLSKKDNKNETLTSMFFGEK